MRPSNPGRGRANDDSMMRSFQTFSFILCIAPVVASANTICEVGFSRFSLLKVSEHQPRAQNAWHRSPGWIRNDRCVVGMSHGVIGRGHEMTMSRHRGLKIGAARSRNRFTLARAQCVCDIRICLAFTHGFQAQPRVGKAYKCCGYVLGDTLVDRRSAAAIASRQ
jgi:hypothetical protein